MGLRELIAAREQLGRYSIRISGQLRADLAAASAKFGASESEIFRMAVRKARHLGLVVFDENNETTTSEEAEEKVLHVYEFDPQPENDEVFFRACLREYLAAHDLTPVAEPEPGSKEREYIRQCTRTAAELIKKVHS